MNITQRHLLVRSARRRLAVFTVAILTAAATVGIAATTSAPAGALPVTYSQTPLAGDQVNGVGLAVLQVGNTVYVGGTFANVLDQTGAVIAQRANLAAFDLGTGRLVSTFRADTDGAVRALATDGTRLFVGGSYLSIGGVARSRLAAVDLATGAVDTGFRAQVNSHVYALARYAGNLVVGGSFSTIGGATRSRLAIVADDTGTVHSFAPTFNDTIVTVATTSDGGKVIVGGNFTTVNGTTRNRAAILDGTTGALAAVQLQNVTGPLSAITVAADDGSLVTSMTGAGNSTNRYNLATGARLWSRQCDGDGQAVDEFGGTTYGGYHEGCGSDTTIRLTAYDTASGVRDTTYRPSFDRFWGVRGIDAAQGGLAIAGDFTLISGIRVSGFAIFPTTVPVTTTTTTTTTLATTTTSTTTTLPTTTTTTTTTTVPPVLDSGFPFALGSTWRYNDDPTAVPAGWATTAFDDSSWRAGPGQFGFGDGDEATLLSYGPDQWNKPVTAYFRRSFSLATVPTSLQLRLIADDGAVVYVNGVEVLRDNMPAGPIGSSTLAASNRSGSAENLVRTFTVPASALVAGTNVISVEVHQDAITSSDLSFDLGLQAG